MKESLRLKINQKLSQKLSPSQIKFVRLLEMNTPEIEEEVRHEVEENPALELADTEIPDSDFNETTEEMMRADYGEDDDVPDYAHPRSGNSAAEYYEPVAVASSMSLLEYLTSQVNQMNVSPDIAATATYIIGNIDPNGYLTRSLTKIADDVAITTGVELPSDMLRKGLEVVQSLDPAGVGAADLRECLLLQLDRKPDGDTVRVAREILTHYFDLFSSGHFDKIRSSLKLDSEAIHKAIELIRTLNPKPGAEIGGDASDDRTRHIIPDFLVETDGDNITVTLTNSIPELQIEQSFSADQKDSKAKAFVKGRRDEAIDFIEMLRLRSETLFAVMTAIVEIQRDFFLTDDESELHPMVLKDVSASTGLDLSVISRATAGKYVATASGIYPLKFFFNTGIGHSDDSASTHACLAAMRKLIDEENHDAPLSDDAITAALVAQGFDIARRTVAKYRQRLGIPVARLRRKF